MQPSNNSEKRHYPLSMPKDWEPPVPAWQSSFADQVTDVAMSVIGIQHEPDTDVTLKLGELVSALSNADIRDFASCDIGGGLHETVCIAYWMNSKNAIDDLYSPQFEALWKQHSTANYGIFREMSNIPLDRSETLFSGPIHKHGMSQVRSGEEGPIERHLYWGGMRDRIPMSETDLFENRGPLNIVEQSANRIVVEAHENLCIIRSGQDWSECDAEQLEEYQNIIEPTLKAGMNFLRDKGEEVNCYSCRYMRDQDDQGTKAKRTFGLAYFKTMADLENWSQHHPTHLEIYNTFLSIAPKHGPNLQLRLWHEVSVLPASGQRAEYINCRPGTGLLSACIAS